MNPQLLHHISNEIARSFLQYQSAPLNINISVSLEGVASTLTQRSQTLQLFDPNHLIRYKDVFHPTLDESLRFAQRLSADSGATADALLKLSQSWTFMSFAMRANFDAFRRGWQRRWQFAEIPFQRV